MTIKMITRKQMAQEKYQEFIKEIGSNPVLLISTNSKNEIVEFDLFNCNKEDAIKTINDIPNFKVVGDVVIHTYLGKAFPLIVKQKPHLK